jgi:3-deoxy-D-manno-octulosonate 8-phosphate phosphatase (KDO 8-P phosphatase)
MKLPISTRGAPVTAPPAWFDAVPADVRARAARVRLALFDVDGVLTDGSLYFTEDGHELKVFHAHDGHGLKMLDRAGIAVAIISARESSAVTRRARELGVKHLYQGVHDKVPAFERLCAELGVTPAECVYTGDDVVDLPIMMRCGLSVTVPNGHHTVKAAALWITDAPGGRGAVREVCDLILYSQDKMAALLPAA